MNGRTTLFLRAVADSTAGLVVLAVIVALVTGGIVAAPRASALLATGDLQHAVRSASAPIRDLQAPLVATSETVRANGDGDFRGIRPVWSAMPDELRHARAGMAPVLQAVTGPGRYVGRSDGVPTHAGAPPNGFVLSGGDGPPAQVTLSLEADPALASDARLVFGRWPRPARTVSPSSPIEIVLTASAARGLGWTLGEIRTIGLVDTSQKLTLVGTVQPRDPGSSFWHLDTARARLGTGLTTDGTALLHGVGWVNAATWPRIGPDLFGSSVLSWFPVLPDRFDGADLGAVRAGVARYLAAPQTFPAAIQPAKALRTSTQLDAILSAAAARARDARGILSLVAGGPFGTGLIVLALGVLLFVARRRPALALLEARGASPTAVRVRLAGEVLVLALPAAVVGGVIGAVITAAAPDSSSILAVVVGILAPPIVAVAALGVPGGERAGRSARRRRSLRLVADLLVIGLAVLALVLGLRTGRAVTAGIDPLLTLAPLLVCLALCLIVLRLYPPVLRLVGAALARGRGGVGFAGWATSARIPIGGLLPVLAVVVGVGIALISLTIVTTDRASIRTASISRVGADLTVTDSALTAARVTAIRRIDGVAATAELRRFGTARLDGDNVSLLLVDSRTVSAAQTGVAPSLRIPAGTGSPPAVLSFGTDAGGDATLGVAGRDIRVQLDSRAVSPLESISDGRFLLAGRAAFPATAWSSADRDAVLVHLAPDAAAGTVAARIQRLVPHAAIASAAAAERTIRSSPIVPAVEVTALAATIVTGMLALAALALALVTAGADRRRRLGVLRALGFSRSGRAAVVAWESGPTVATGVVAGTAAGLLLPAVILPTLDLSGFTGGGPTPVVIVRAALIAGGLAAFLGGSALVTIIAGRAGSGRRSGSRLHKAASTRSRTRTRTRTRKDES